MELARAEEEWRLEQERLKHEALLERFRREDDCRYAVLDMLYEAYECMPLKVCIIKIIPKVSIASFERLSPQA